MAKKRSLFGFLRKKSLGSKTIVLSELDYLNATEDIDQRINDYSKIDLESTDFISPKIHEKFTKKPQIPIIGIGGCGVRLISSIAKRLEQYNIEYPVLGIETDQEELNKYDNITHKFLIPGTTTGTAKQYRKGATLAQQSKDDLKESIEKYLSDFEQTYKHEIIFLVFGAGGTGVGAGIEIATLLQELGKRPVPFFFFPGKSENTRIKFNAAVALYRLNYAPGDRCLKLITICIDNEYFFAKNTRNSYPTVISAINERNAAAIGDLLISTELNSDGYSADLTEFLEIFRNIKGIGTLSYMHSSADYETVTSFFEAKQSISNSIEVDILTSTRSYCFIQATRNKITSEDFRKLISKFDNSDIFTKFVEIDEESNNYEIRGIFTGIKLPHSIEVLMQLAEDARVSVLNTEIKNAKEGKVNPKIDRLQGEEEIEVKTGEELTKERSEEYAELRRRGDVT